MTKLNCEWNYKVGGYGTVQFKLYTHVWVCTHMFYVSKGL